MFVVSVVCCQVQVLATSKSLIQRSLTDCVASCSINLKNEEVMARVVLQSHKTKDEFNDMFHNSLAYIESEVYLRLPRFILFYFNF